MKHSRPSNPPTFTVTGTIPSPRGGQTDDAVIRAQPLSPTDGVDGPNGISVPHTGRENL